MIQMPKRSVTRFFIPLIDVLTLLFCIFLLMPMVRSAGDLASDNPQPAAISMLAEERQELEQLRREKRAWMEWNRLQEELKLLSAKVREALEQGLFLRVLEIGDEGKLYFYDPARERDRRVEITKENVEKFIETQKRLAQGRELYLLILYPRRPEGFPGFPLQGQREDYDRWFKDVAHGYDIPYRNPQMRLRN
jgi:hypothetical protein